jgi:heme exporter protein CcmD
MLTELLHMGGYGVYVWTAYSMTLLVFGINFLAAWNEKRKTKKIVQQFLAKSTQYQ